MNKYFLNRVMTLMAVPALAVTGLLLVFLLLGWSTVGATPGGAGPIPDVLAQIATFTVSGTVTCEATGPISDVEVFAWNRDGGAGFMGDTTDSSGYYSVTLADGNYDLNFNPPCGSGYASKTRKGITGPFDLTLNVVLSPGHTVSGTVTDGTTPISDVAIYAFNHETADGFGLTLTDANGHYCIGLITGTYDLGFTPPACLGLGSKTEVIYITQDTTLDVILPMGFTVAGCVTDGLGNPVPGVQIYAKDPDIGGFGFAPTNESGCYSGTLPYAGTPPTGTYDIQFIPPPGFGLGSVTEIDVVSTTTNCPNTTLPITLPTGYTLSGKVTCNGGGIKNVYIYALPEEPHGSSNSLPGYGLFTVDDGSYGLPLVSGTYVLTFTPPAATGLNAKAFTIVELLTDTVLNVDFCVCCGVWVTETVDSVGDVGRQPSLSLEPIHPYTPHISYYDATNGDLKHAWLSGTTWISGIVDSEGNVGERSSLALAPSYPYTVVVSYYDEDGWGLRYACRDETSWTILEGDSGCSGQFGTSLALEPTYPFTPHISYQKPFGLYDLRHTYLSGTVWCNGTWRIETVDSEGNTGGESSLALEPEPPYSPQISYCGDGNLKYAWLNDTTWFSETVDDSVEIIGRYTSLALEPTSPYTPHISYFDFTNGDLKYAWFNGSVWISETVDSGGKVGEWTSLALNSSGRPYISYYDATNGDLKFAHFNGTLWIIRTVDGGGNVGRGTSLVLDQAGCPHIIYYDVSNGDLKYAYMPAPVAAGFSASPTAGVAPLTVTFTNTSAGDYTTSLWDFGDKLTSTAESPTHTYATGFYTVALTVSGPGGTDTLTRPNYITVYEPVQADFAAWPITGVAPLTVTFTNTSTGDYTDSLWDFGDGVISTTNSPTYTYTTKGIYTVALTVSGPGGTETLTRPNYITVYEPVQADFTAWPITGVAPLTVTFTNTSTGDYTTSLWDFGDEATSTLTNPTHLYTATGLYTVVLTVSGPGGSNTETKPEYIKVDYGVYLPLIMRNY